MKNDTNKKILIQEKTLNLFYDKIEKIYINRYFSVIFFNISRLTDLYFKQILANPF